MRKSQKIKFQDLVDKSTKINVNEMQKIVGGERPGEMINHLTDGCQSGICSQRINPEYCDGGAVCTSGIAG